MEELKTPTPVLHEDQVLNEDENTISEIKQNQNAEHEEGSDIDNKEAETSTLIGKVMKNEEDAYDLYNDYAFTIGFSIRREKVRRRLSDKSIIMREYACSRAGLKTSEGKCYRKLDTRTNCQAKLRCFVDKNGVHTVRLHDMVHNHLLCPEDKRHLMRSQRNVTDEDIDYLLLLVESGIKLSDALRALKKEKGGTPLLGFITKDAYNKVAQAKKKKLDGSDCMKLLNTLRERKENEVDFFFSFDVDEDGCLDKFFWRDSTMKEDYLRFGDLLIHDTTYRTNRYDMICGPFVGVNHHAQNLMFGCGFLVDETTESFVWLFDTFLKSMDGAPPKTIMTDQSFAMAAAIKQIFPESNHRICLWHLLQNSKKNIPHLRALDGFNDMFRKVLMYCDSQAEFEFYWQRMNTIYECHDTDWLKNLYKSKHKWCVPFTKDIFSAAVLSSQRAEVTNKCVSQKLNATSGMNDFYYCYNYVLKDWKRTENGEDHRCQQGNPEMIGKHIKILEHARSIYTIEIYNLFQEQYIKSWSMHHDLVPGSETELVYHIGKPGEDLIKHVVTLNLVQQTINCTCKLITELGILCSHSLRVMALNCMDEIPERYILKRWTKDAIQNTPLEIGESRLSAARSSSVWRTQMCRKFNELVTISSPNEKVRDCLETGYNTIKQLVEDKLQEQESTEQSEVQQEPAHSEAATMKVKEPSKRRKPGTKNVRIKPKIEKVYNVVAGKRAKAFRTRNHTQKSVHAMVQHELRNILGEGYATHPVDGGPKLAHFPSFGVHPSAAANQNQQFASSTANQFLQTGSAPPANQFQPSTSSAVNQFLPPTSAAAPPQYHQFVHPPSAGSFYPSAFQSTANRDHQLSSSIPRLTASHLPPVQRAAKPFPQNSSTTNMSTGFWRATNSPYSHIQQLQQLLCNTGTPQSAEISVKTGSAGTPQEAVLC